MRSAIEPRVVALREDAKKGRTLLFRATAAAWNAHNVFRGGS